MLKIKDDVDLKELEKFGFRNYPNHYEEWGKIFENSMSGSVVIRITNDRIVYPVIDLQLYNLGHQSEFELHNTLYDLIKADLVEKVDDR